MPRGTSLTASAVCLFRALEHARGPARRLEDPFAARLLPHELAAVASSSLAAQALLGGRGVWLGAGALARYVIARHRVLDAVMLDFLAAGGEQVVVLGAGLDARGLRFPRELGGATLFEVDFPATQRHKRARLEAAGLSERASATRFVEVDFEREDLSSALRASGLNVARPTCFLWEGVTMYLAPEAVHATLSALAAVTPPRQPLELTSRLAFDVWVRPPGSLGAAVRAGLGALLGFVGEPFKFALAPDEAPRMLARAGWRVRNAHDRAALATNLGVPALAICPDVCVFDAERQPAAPTSAAPTPAAPS
jgi:methyltransferase (TIGR00027 family)